MSLPGRTEEGLIQHRFGYSYDLPDYLEEAEIAMTVDTGGVFIGAPMYKPLDGRERIASNIYPFHNIEILTEVSDNTKIIKIPFDIYNNVYNLPIVLVGYTAPQITNNDYISVNGKAVSVNISDITLDEYVNTLNAKLHNETDEDYFKNISFDTFEDKIKIVFHSTAQSDTLTITSLSDQALQHFGLVSPDDTTSIQTVIYRANIQPRSLGEVLSDKITIKTFGVENNDTSNCSTLTNSAIDVLYRNSQEYMKKEIYFPAGTYRYDTDTIWLFSNAKLIGENKPLFKYSNSSILSMISNTDILGFLSTNINNYGVSAGDITNISIDNINLYSTVNMNGMEFYGVSDLTIKNCDITNNSGRSPILDTDNSLIFDGIYAKSTTSVSTLVNVANIVIDNCTLNGGNNGIKIVGLSKENRANNIIIKNVSFKNISTCCIDLQYCKNVIIEHCDFSDSSISGKFINVFECDKVIVRDCIYPEDFNLTDGNNNKIIFENSDIDIKDYFIARLTADDLTDTVLIPNSSEIYNIRMEYDLISESINNRSGILNLGYLNPNDDAQTVQDRLDDSNAKFNPNTQEPILFFKAEIINSILNITFDKHDNAASAGYIRYKLHITTMADINPLITNP